MLDARNRSFADGVPKQEFGKEAKEVANDSVPDAFTVFRNAPYGKGCLRVVKC
jgi:hypothetical protein